VKINLFGEFAENYIQVINVYDSVHVSTDITDSIGSIVKTEWKFGDVDHYYPVSFKDTSIAHTLDIGEVFEANVRVTDDDGNTVTARNVYPIGPVLFPKIMSVRNMVKNGTGFLLQFGSAYDTVGYIETDYLGHTLNIVKFPDLYYHDVYYHDDGSYHVLARKGKLEPNMPTFLSYCGPRGEVYWETALTVNDTRLFVAGDGSIYTASDYNNTAPSDVFLSKFTPQGTLIKTVNAPFIKKVTWFLNAGLNRIILGGAESNVWDIDSLIISNLQAVKKEVFIMSFASGWKIDLHKIDVAGDTALFTTIPSIPGISSNPIGKSVLRESRYGIFSLFVPREESPSVYMVLDSTGNVLHNIDLINDLFAGAAFEEPEGNINFAGYSTFRKYMHYNYREYPGASGYFYKVNLATGEMYRP
jgi:hypothetical protein